MLQLRTRKRTRTCKLVLEDPRGQGLPSRTTTLSKLGAHLCRKAVVALKPRRSALDRVQTHAGHSIDRLKYVFALCDPVIVTFDLLT